jgi:hypothetical protein
VHHAVNPRYLDKNYGGILIVWDRMFGTFAEERERPVYGTTKPFGSFNPVWAQIAYFFELRERARRLPRLGDKLKLLAMPPDWDPTAAQPHAEIRERAKHETGISRGRRIYALLQFVPLVALTFLLMLQGPAISREAATAAVALLFLSLLAIGALLDGRRWGWPLEGTRLGAIAAAGAVWMLVGR